MAHTQSQRSGVGDRAGQAPVHRMVFHSEEHGTRCLEIVGHTMRPVPVRDFEMQALECEEPMLVPVLQHHAVEGGLQKIFEGHVMMVTGAFEILGWGIEVVANSLEGLSWRHLKSPLRRFL